MVPRLSLRWRVAAAFGLGSVLVTSLLAIATWNLASDYMLRQRVQATTRQAEVNLRLVEEAVRSNSDGLTELLTGLTTNPDSTIMLFRGDEVLTSGRQVDPAVVPPQLIVMARDGTPARQRLRADGIPVIAVAQSLADGQGVYVELFQLVQLDRTFRFLSGLLIAGTVLSGMLGVGLGSWASRRALRPLTELTDAASRIAGGDLKARLPSQRDPDLGPLASTFNTTADALEQRVLRDARFAGDVSHELRSPLTTMVNAAAVLRRRQAELPGTAGKALGLLTSEVDRFARMVVDLMEISRADQDGDKADFEPLDVGGLVHGAAGLRLGQDVEIVVEPPPPLVLGDRRRLDRVIGNLIENAEQHAGGAVRLAVLHQDGNIRLEVDDAGPGVPRDMRSQVFERFTRGARAGSRGADTGSGLGLALVAEHVRRHHGEVWVEDRPGGGARFVVELPEAFA
ncbi:sensor histidine kinase [Lentzea flaviverrucosa]|uniref:histidine kinase n=1 Tax=Lentzea flaviverrucosa TaxID=200379 RepID=A0A1H9XW76_9PSEU|nr:HAMP domain-containing sensor histidine kinase [Lentzea flaviverrucosa]RDI34394.1 signal transduction histidine kinase [Lentzea flaviverrucosa]SES50435.1 Signal transduction histidine kinase [Lentzea flaviverrucosa]